MLLDTYISPCMGAEPFSFFIIPNLSHLVTLSLLLQRQICFNILLKSCFFFSSIYHCSIKLFYNSYFLNNANSINLLPTPGGTKHETLKLSE